MSPSCWPSLPHLNGFASAAILKWSSCANVALRRQFSRPLLLFHRVHFWLSCRLQRQVFHVQMTADRTI
ncbi:hypothetical protein M440DRAFT_1007621 [Trichoderma longibrachiatum ATCC 18648]|uniref:Uncharacterized protein n=1 Tax=Trichoderma longibrachiatum ATCC 18648 TaxID=983965 RepID=A0A2T4CHS6_TRILO|nr:hypothetical protein M440DRAFT_1007621 [Trichoderma longibrachiatum ATCC 18648]